MFEILHKHFAVLLSGRAKLDLPSLTGQPPMGVVRVCSFMAIGFSKHDGIVQTIVLRARRDRRSMHKQSSEVGRRAAGRAPKLTIQGIPAGPGSTARAVILHGRVHNNCDIY